MVAAQTTPELPDLEVPCEICQGRGGQFSCEDGSGLYCLACGGAGYVPTEFGGKVLALMRHNFRPLLDQVEDE